MPELDSFIEKKERMNAFGVMFGSELFYFCIPFTVGFGHIFYSVFCFLIWGRQDSFLLDELFLAFIKEILKENGY